MAKHFPIENSAVIDPEKLSQGIDNLLFNCAELKPKDELLIIREKESLDWYKNDVSELLKSEAINKGLKTKVIEVGEPDNSNKNSLLTAVNEHTCTIFFARLGDQDRFEEKKYYSKRVMSYVRSAEQLASTFGTINYKANVAFKNSIDKIFNNAREVVISCPLGTNLKGYIDNKSQKISSEVSVIRFPLVVPKPIECLSFSGNVVIDNYLTSTGSKVYKPNFLKINKQTNFVINKGRISNIEGEVTDVENIKKHYKNISKEFHLDSDCVHSWHPGLHPAVTYSKPIDKDPDQWSNTMFASPRFLHFHTCGNYAPGEICWMLEKHSVFIDNKPLWKRGCLMPYNFKETSECIEKYKELINLYNN